MPTWFACPSIAPASTTRCSPKGYASERHGPGINMAVDAPDSLNATSAKAFMSIWNDLITGAYIPPKLVEQYKRFIELNREALIDYWECRVDTTDLLGRIVSGFERMRKRKNKYTRGEGLSLAGQFDQLRHLNAEGVSVSLLRPKSELLPIKIWTYGQ
jgi:hypothetical protein